MKLHCVYDGTATPRASTPTHATILGPAHVSASRVSRAPNPPPSIEVIAHGGPPHDTFLPHFLLNHFDLEERYVRYAGL